MAMNSSPSASPISYSWQMFGWLTLAASRASRQNRSRTMSSLAVSRRMTFRATERPSRSSTAA